MAPTIFPQELFDLIVDEVAANHNPNSRLATLKACSLASVSLSHTARRHLFSSITIQYNIVHDRRGSEKYKRIEALWNVLKRDPRLAACVRIFELELNTDWTHLPDMRQSIQPQIDALVLPGILNTLTRAQQENTEDGYRGRLDTLGLGGYNCKTVSWNDFSPEFRYSWQTLYASSDLKYLRVGRMRPFPSGITLRPGIQRLELGGDVIDANATISNAASFPQLACASLRELDCILSTDTWIQTNINSCTKVVELSASSLQTLKIFSTSKMNPYENIFPTINIGSLTALKTLTFELREVEVNDLEALFKVTEFLYRSSSNCVQEVQINLIMQTPPNFESCDRACHILKLLDEVLSQKSFIRLQKVSFRALWTSHLHKYFPFPTPHPSSKNFLAKPISLLHLLPLTRKKLSKSFHNSLR